MNRFFLLSLLANLPTASSAQSANRADLIARMDQADANHDGNVTRNELIAWRKANFTRFDRNGDGTLSDADIPGILRGTSIGAQFTALRAQFDANRDGRVTRDEFVGAPTVIFDAADLDHDNVLTRAERDTAVAVARSTKG